MRAIVVHYKELSLKGRNRPWFVQLLTRNIKEALAGLGVPAVRSAQLIRSTVVRERQATFSLAPGQPARPSTTTPIRGLVLAGDWIDTGLPATIESAVRSGHRAAEAIS